MLKPKGKESSQTTYMNYAATSLHKPQPVIDAVTNYLQNNNEITPQRSYLNFSGQNIIFQGREAVADFFHAKDSSKVIFTQNITLSLNMILHGLLQTGDHVITTSVEHNAVMRPLYLLEQEGVEVSYLACDTAGELTSEKIESALQKNTKLLVMTHASNVLASVLPVERCFEIAHKHKLLTVLDTAQTAGFLPIDQQSLHIDVLAFTGHKSLLALTGIGGFILSEKAAQQMQPWLTGGTGLFSDSVVQPDILPDKFEAGTPNNVGILSLKTSLEWIKQVGIKNIQESEQALTQQFLSGLKGMPLKILGNTDVTNRVPVVSVVPQQLEVNELAQFLYEDYGIITRHGLHCAPSAHKTAGSFETGALRFSFGFETTTTEIDHCLIALEKILTKGGN